MDGGLVGLLIVCIMVFLGVYVVVLCVVVCGVQRISLLILFVVAVGVVDVLDGVLSGLGQRRMSNKISTARAY